MKSTEQLLTAERLREDAERIRQAHETLRQANEVERAIAEEGRIAAAKEVTGTVATLRALLDRMEAVETMRRTSRFPNGLSE